jgi:hypothetical protein
VDEFKETPGFKWGKGSSTQGEYLANPSPLLGRHGEVRNAFYLESVSRDMFWHQCWDCKISGIYPDPDDPKPCPEEECDGFMMVVFRDPETGKWDNL